MIRTPEQKARRRAYQQQADVKEKSRAYLREWRRLRKIEEQAQESRAESAPATSWRARRKERMAARKEQRGIT